MRKLINGKCNIFNSKIHFTIINSKFQRDADLLTVNFSVKMLSCIRLIPCQWSTELKHSIPISDLRPLHRLR